MQTVGARSRPVLPLVGHSEVRVPRTDPIHGDRELQSRIGVLSIPPPWMMVAQPLPRPPLVSQWQPFPLAVRQIYDAENYFSSHACSNMHIVCK